VGGGRPANGRWTAGGRPTAVDWGGGRGTMGGGCGLRMRAADGGQR
jgi:hypothetical protein